MDGSKLDLNTAQYEQLPGWMFIFEDSLVYTTVLPCMINYYEDCIPEYPQSIDS